MAIVPTNAAGVDGIPSEARPATEPAIARQTALQIAEAARHLPDRPVEITLNPEELGRVRMTLSAADDAIVVTLAVERGETADLLRRHIETLAQEFRSLGYRDISFEFGGGHGGAGMDNPADQESQAKDQGSGIDPAPADPGPAPLRIDLGGRVDMRI
ncbi:MAG: flagellar hook-length control protein FliK [Rhodobacter sp.]|nr:flagellar hook-length control protein FliK [Rhodobacter sp.]